MTTHHAPPFIPTASFPISSTHPRIAAAVKWAGILSTGETECALRDFRAGDNWSGEAVNHFGGTKKLIQVAFACRHLHRRGCRVFRVETIEVTP